MNDQNGNGFGTEHLGPEALQQQQPDAQQRPAPSPEGQSTGQDGASQTEGDQAADGGEKKTKPEGRTYSQADVERIARRAEARGERRAQRFLSPQQQPSQSPDQGRQGQQPAGEQMPRRDQFQTDEQWLDARDAFRDRQREAADRQRESQRAQQDLATKSDRIYRDAEKAGDFDRDAFDEVLTPQIARAVMASEFGAQLAVYLSQNPEKASEMSEMSPAAFARAVARIEIGFEDAARGGSGSQSQPAQRVSRAPAPPSRVGTGGSSGPTSGDLSGAQSQKDYEAMRARQSAPWARRTSSG